MKQIKTISIKCETSEKLEIAEMTEMQGGLKERTDIDYDKIKLSICKFGFSFPFFIWKSGNKNYLIDGHGRFATLCKMQKDGYLIPPLPVVYIQCKNKTEAKQKLLRLNSQYGKMTKESVLEFAEDIDLNFDEIALPDTVIDFTEEEIPENLDEDLQSLEKKDFKVSLVFKSEEQIKDFIEMYEQELKEKYNCYVSVAGGGLMKLTRATTEAIKYACLHFHYAKCVPVGVLGYNVYNDKNEWCGVILYARGANPNMSKEFNLANGEALELVRVALNGKQEQTSKAVAISLKLIKKDCPLCKLIISYADMDQDHYGIIYQATNWIYTGDNSVGQKGNAYIINGKRIHAKTVKDRVYHYFEKFSIDNIKKVYHTEDVQDYQTKGKRRYLYPLNEEMRKQVIGLKKEYPKSVAK